MRIFKLERPNQNCSSENEEVNKQIVAHDLIELFRTEVEQKHSNLS